MATEYIKYAFDVAQQADDIQLQLMSLQAEQYIAWRCENPHWTIEVTRRARDIAGISMLNPLQGSWLQREANAHLLLGNLSRALDLCAEVEADLKAAGMEASTGYLAVLDHRAFVLALKSEYLEARELYMQMLKRTSTASSPGYHAHAHCCVAEMNILMEREAAETVSHLNAAETVYASLGSPRSLLCSRLAGELKLSHRDTQNALAAFLDCLSRSRDIYPVIVGDCLAALADPAHRMQGTMDIFRWAVVYLAFVQKAKNREGTLQALRRLADLHMAINEEETALHLFHTTLETATQMDIHRLRAECMVGIGDIMARRGDLIQAKELWTAAHPLFTRSSRMRDAASVETRLNKLPQQVNSHSLLAIQDRAPSKSTLSLRENSSES
jgi:tetratricopeptide (TPR) repeat protein